MPNGYGMTWNPATDGDAVFTQALKRRIGEALLAVCDDLAPSGAKPQGAFATLVDRLLSLESVASAGGVRRLQIHNNGSSAAQLSYSWDALGVESLMSLAVSGTLDITTVGLNGRSTSSAIATGFYAVWAVANPTTGAAGLVLDTSFTNPTLSHASIDGAGFKLKRLIGDVRNLSTGSANLRRQAQRNDVITIGDPGTDARVVSAAATTTTAQTVTPTTVYPSYCRRATLAGRIAPNTASQACTLLLRMNGIGITSGGIELAHKPTQSSTVLELGRDIDLPLDANGAFQWVCTNADSGTSTVTIDVVAYQVPL